ncbi:MAG: NAD(P)-dependent oxidoreductase [Candidatus Thorarchaeota archaeon]
MKILVTAPYTEDELNRLREKGEVIYENWQITGNLEFNSKNFIKRINDNNIDIIITEADEIDEEVIDNTNLKLIASTRGTPVNVDRESATKKKIPIVYAPHRNADAVADLTVMMMLIQARKYVGIERLLKSESFDISDYDEAEFGEFFTKYRGNEIGNLEIGIIGFGAIGSRVAKRLHLGFGSKILYHDPYVPEDDPVVKLTNATSVNLQELMKSSDMVTLHVPPITETDGLIGKEEFALMKPTAHFFNLARSFSIDEDALYEAIENKRIAGAGLDVFDEEPVDSENRFLKFDNVVVTPHIGGNTYDVIKHQSKMITEDILKLFENKRPKNIWNREIYK